MFDCTRLAPTDRRRPAPLPADTAGQAKLKKLLLANVTALALCAAVTGYQSPANATIVYVTVDGTASGHDQNGDFGTAGESLSNVVYTAQYEFDTSIGTDTSSAFEISATGGSNASPVAASPSLGAGITINGRTFSITGSYFALIDNVNYGSGSSATAEAYDANAELNEYTYAMPASNPASIVASFSLDVADNESTMGYIGSFTDSSGAGTALTLTISTYTESLTAPGSTPPSAPTDAPEPASMALLSVALVGLGVIRGKRA